MKRSRTFDGAGRQTAQYITDGAGGTANAATPASDHVLTEQLTTYDKNGNVISTTSLDRYDTVVLGGAGPTGSLTSSDSRISYVRNWYDAGNRLFESVNYGTHGGAAPSDLSPTASAPARVVSSNGWDLALVTTYGYSDGGYMDDVTDPRGIQTKQFFDATGRVMQTIQGYTGQVFNWSPAASPNAQITTYLYDRDGRVQFQNVKTVGPTGATVSNTTEFVYDAGNPFNAPNSTYFEDPDNGQRPANGSAGNVQFDNYDFLGSRLGQTDRSGSLHLYSYDAMGRLLSDTLQTYIHAGFATQNLDVQGRGYGYDVFGRMIDASTYDLLPTDPARKTTSDVAFVYDGLGHLTDELQLHSVGKILPGTSYTNNPQKIPDVHYDYYTNYGLNYSRMTDEMYPNGPSTGSGTFALRVLLYNYDGNDGLDNSISRLSSITEDTGAYAGQNLAKYTYLGLGTMVSEELPQEQVKLSYRATDGGSSVAKNPNTGNLDAGPSDPYSGLDRFGRIIDQNWFVIGQGTIDRHQYAYDADSNLLYDHNLGPTTQLQTLNETYGAYDPLNRPTTFSGPWGAESFANSSKGVYQHSTANAQPVFQGVFVAGTLISQYHPGLIPNDPFTMSNVMYDYQGTPSPQATEWQVPSISVQFDAWGDLTRLQEWNTTFSVDNNTGTLYRSSVSTGDYSYRYDALGRRISENGNALYYDASGNIIEERNSTTSPAATIQYFYSPVDNTLILRDRALYTGGNIGAIGSGLSERLYAIHDARNSVDTILGVRAGGGPGVVEERYLYQSTGQVIVLDTNGANGLAGSQNSAFNWRILYHGSRDDGTSYYSDFYYLNGTEWNSLTGLPVQEDPTAYLNQKHIYDASVAANARGFTDWVGDHASTIITFIRIASWANPIVGFAVNYAADVMDRLAPLDGSPGQSWDDALLGGAMDVSGITGIYGYIKGKDIATGSTRGWGSQADRELNGFLGVLQAAPLFGALAKSMVGGMSSGMQGGGMALNNGAAVLTGTWSPGLAGVGTISGLGSLQGLGSIGNSVYSLMKAGGQVDASTGPKTDNRFGHNRMIRKVAREVTANGDEVIAGGRMFDGVYRKEAVFKTAGGFKSARRPDLLVLRPDGSIYGINVGRSEVSGLPILRERLAIQDLNEQAGLEMQFVSYGGPR